MKLDRCNDSSGWIVKDLDEAFGYNSVQCFADFRDAMTFIADQIRALNCDDDQYVARGWQLHSVQANTLLATFWNYTRTLPELQQTEDQLWEILKDKENAEEKHRQQLLNWIDMLGFDGLTEEQRLQVQDFAYFIGGSPLRNTDNLAKLYPLSEETTKRMIATLLAVRNYGDFGVKELKSVVAFLQSTIN